MLLNDDGKVAQLFLTDLLGHAGCIWEHVVGWSKDHDPYGIMVLGHAREMGERFHEWTTSDPIAHLPPPP